jgi:hypothetical protein
VILSNIWHDPGAKTSIWHDPEAKLDLLPEAKTRLEAETWKQKKGFLLAINGRGQKIKQKPGFCFVRKHSNQVVSSEESYLDIPELDSNIPRIDRTLLEVIVSQFRADNGKGQVSGVGRGLVCH